jgi:hypothetical protein
MSRGFILLLRIRVDLLVPRNKVTKVRRVARSLTVLIYVFYSRREGASSLRFLGVHTLLRAVRFLPDQNSVLRAASPRQRD